MKTQFAIPFKDIYIYDIYDCIKIHYIWKSSKK
jgi:hypothetical protein